MITYDILIPTIPHRHKKLAGLLADIDVQWQPGLGVIAYRDNLQASLRAKNQALLNASQADYVSWCDDDDWLQYDYVHQVMTRLGSWPDYIGFEVAWSVNGIMQLPVEHSLRHHGWVNGEDQLTRDITALNPIRRSIALQAKWDFHADHGADRDWSRQVRETGLCKTERFIPAQMYFYRSNTDDTFLMHREPMPEPLPLLPSYHWLTVIEGQPHA